MSRQAAHIDEIVAKIADSEGDTLNLERCRINDTIMGQVIPNIKDKLMSTDATRLCISKNRIGPSGCDSLCSFLDQTNVTELDFGHNFLRSEGIIRVAQFLVQPNSKISRLSIRDNGCDDAGVQQFANILCRLRKPLALDISESSIHATGLLALAKTISEYGYIHELILERVHVNRESMRALSVALGSADDDTVVVLNSGTHREIPWWKRILCCVSDVQYDQDQTLLLSSMEGNPSGLTYLDLSQCHIEANSAAILCNALQRSTALKTLILRDNGGEGIVSICRAVVSQGVLSTLDVSSNGGGPECTGGLSLLMQTSHVKRLYASRNRIRNEGMIEIGRLLASSSLEVLELSSNHAGGDGVMAVVKAAPPSLISLDVSHNVIGLEFGAKLLDVISQKPHLSVNVRHCKLGDWESKIMKAGSYPDDDDVDTPHGQDVGDSTSYDRPSVLDDKSSEPPAPRPTPLEPPSATPQKQQLPETEDFLFFDDSEQTSQKSKSSPRVESLFHSMLKKQASSPPAPAPSEPSIDDSVALI